jgi:hypothetical protein
LATVVLVVFRIVLLFLKLQARLVKTPFLEVSLLLVAEEAIPVDSRRAP